MQLPGDKDKLNKIEELKGKLFSKNYRPRIESRDTFTHHLQKEVPVSWHEEGEKVDFKQKLFMQTSIFKKFFLL